MWAYLFVGAYLGALILALVDNANWMNIGEVLKDYGTIIVGIPASLSILFAVQQWKSAQRQHAVEIFLNFEAELTALQELEALAISLCGRASSKHNPARLMALGYRAGVREPRELNDLLALLPSLTGRVKGRAQAAADWAAVLTDLINQLNKGSGALTEPESDTLERTEQQLYSASVLARSLANERRTLIEQRLDELGVPRGSISLSGS